MKNKSIISIVAFLLCLAVIAFFVGRMLAPKQVQYLPGKTKTEIKYRDTTIYLPGKTKTITKIVPKYINENPTDSKPDSDCIGIFRSYTAAIDTIDNMDTLNCKVHVAAKFCQLEMPNINITDFSLKMKPDSVVVKTIEIKTTVTEPRSIWTDIATHGIVGIAAGLIGYTAGRLTK